MAIAVVVVCDCLVHARCPRPSPGLPGKWVAHLNKLNLKSTLGTWGTGVLT